MQIAEFLTARTMGLCLVFQSMPPPLFLSLLLHLGSCLCCLCFCSLISSHCPDCSRRVNYFLFWVTITFPQSSITFVLLPLFIFLFICVEERRAPENDLWESILSFHYVNSGAWTQVTCRLDVKHLYPLNHWSSSLCFFETGSFRPGWPWTQ